MPVAPVPSVIDVWSPQRRERTLWLALVFILALIVLSTIMSSYYTVDPDSVGVLTRFGRFTGLAFPGLHFKLPLGIDRVQAVPIQREQKAEFGFRTKEAAVRTIYEPASADVNDESLMLTGDLNAAVVEWSVQFRIHDAKAFVFDIRDPEGTLRDASEAVMRGVVGDHTVDEVLTVMRQQVENQAQIQLQHLMDTYAMGIRIDRVVLQDVTPPEPVKAAFSEVNQAQQEREQLINKARTQYNQVVPRAQGEAQQLIQNAEGYAAERVNQAQGDATLFDDVFTAYRKAPEATRRRMYLETMSAVIPKLGHKFVIDDQTRSILPLLQLTPEALGAK